MADTSYNFSFTGFNGMNVSGGVITIDSSNNITNISGTVSGSGADGNINGLVTNHPYVASDNKFYYPANPGYFTDINNSGGVNFYTGNYSENTTSNVFTLAYWDSMHAHFLTDADIFSYDNGSMSASPASAAAVPEIDGALIPQVGFLLAGLFLMFGRRKENPEPMLAN